MCCAARKEESIWNFPQEQLTERFSFIPQNKLHKYEIIIFTTQSAVILMYEWELSSLKAIEPSQWVQRKWDGLLFCLRAAVLFYMDLLHVSAAGFFIITTQHYSNLNISPEFVCQMSYTISDKNNGFLQSKSGVSRALNQHATTKFPLLRER